MTASACPLDCPDTCSLDVTVENGRVTRVNGSSVNPYTNGVICAKVRKFDRHMYGADRVTTPLLRQGAKGAADFKSVSWKEALDHIAKRLSSIRDEFGGEAILPFAYGGSNGYLTDGIVDERLFRRLGASRLEKTVCAAPSSSAARGLYGRMPGTPFLDYDKAECIVVWGANPHASGIHLVPVLKRARDAGAKLVVIDPRQTKLAKLADVHLPIRPGTDVALALAFIRECFASGRAATEFLDRHAVGVGELRERANAWPIDRAAEVCGLPAEDLRKALHLYLDASPAVVRCGYGLERNRNGGSAVAAVLALPAVAGKFGVRGGGFTMSQSAALVFDLEPAIAEPPTTTRSVNMNQLGRALLDGERPAQALFVYNANPLSTIPEQNLVRQGLLREDLFTVTFDAVMTDTARFADVVLPATTFLEHRELRRSYGTGIVLDAPPVAPPVGEARPNYEVFSDLLERMGLARPDDPVTPDALVDSVLNAHDEGMSIRSQLAENGAAVASKLSSPLPFVNSLPTTADQKIHLVPEELEAEHPTFLYDYLPDPETDAYPLALISPALAQTISSTFGQLLGSVSLELHPQDAASRSIRTGDRVRVFNDAGEVHCLAQVSEEMRPGVIFLPKGIWAKSTENGRSSNALCPDSLTDLGRGACFNDARVQVEPLRESADFDT